MAQRRRYATRDELVDLLGRAVSDVCSPAAVIDHLAQIGVDVDGLVKLTVDEADVATYPTRGDNAPAR